MGRNTSYPHGSLGPLTLTAIPMGSQAEDFLEATCLSCRPPITTSIIKYNNNHYHY